MDKNTINIAVIGKTGVGKSSFCNYVFGEDVFRTGTGKPVTKMSEDFKFHTVKYNDYYINLYDSVGIEPDNLKERENSILRFIKSNSCTVSSKLYRPNTFNDFMFEYPYLLGGANLAKMRSNSDPGKWIHTIIYLVNAASARIEPAEVELIKKIQGLNVPLQVVLTNVDNASPEECEGLVSEVKEIDEKIVVSKICSVSKITRAGKVEPFGKDEVLNLLLNGLNDKLKKSILLSFLFNFRLSIIEAKLKFEKSINDSDIGIIKIIREAIRDNDFDFDEIFDIDLDFLKDSENPFSESAEAIDNFLLAHDFDSDMSISGYIDDFYFEIEDVFYSFEEKLDEMGDEIDKNLDDGFIGLFRVLKEIMPIIFNLKKFIIETFEPSFNDVIRVVDAKIKEVEEMKI